MSRPVFVHVLSCYSPCRLNQRRGEWRNQRRAGAKPRGEDVAKHDYHHSGNGQWLSQPTGKHAQNLPQWRRASHLHGRSLHRRICAHMCRRHVWRFRISAASTSYPMIFLIASKLAWFKYCTCPTKSIKFTTLHTLHSEKDVLYSSRKLQRNLGSKYSRKVHQEVQFFGAAVQPPVQKSPTFCARMQQR